MKHLRFVLTVVLLSLTTMAFAQHDTQAPVAQADAQKPSVAPVTSAAQSPSQP